MIRLKFQALQEARSITVGPAEAFRVSGNFLRQLPNNTVIGQYYKHQWHVREGSFARYDCIDTCLIYFTDVEGTASQTFGPFEKMHVADGTMYAADELFAKFIDETLNWHSMKLETYWPNLILTSAG